MNFRRLEQKDIAQVIFLWKELMKEHTELESKFYSLAQNSSEIQKQFLQKSISSADKFLLGCFDGKKLVGYLFGEIEKRPPVLKVDEIGYVIEIFVSKLYRKKGIGKNLFQEFCGWCEKQGVFAIQLIVLEEKEVVSFYYKLGFRDFMKKMLFEIPKH